MGDMGMAFYLHNMIRFKQWWLDNKYIGRSQQASNYFSGLPNSPSNYVAIGNRVLRTCMWVDPNLNQLAVTFKCYGQPNFAAEAFELEQ